ncbi:hypothetical protein ANCDUO_13838 [Ancylostoma duodenale]|uniref:cDENN domain-containing protein n=1 Tax=Ancylostoma duodenale TaxID=51022 RepID=A0A0C2D1U1_9BILA|nr:hypothetical protein ANCDUO_13838 [Ancylostoma duodenale]
MSLLHTEHVRKLTAGEPPLDRERHHVPPGTVSGGTHTLPRGRRNRTKRISYYDGGGHNTLFMSKTLCLITRLPLVCSTTTILRTLHEVLTSGSQPELPLESYIYWILNEIPLPSPGTTLKVSMLDSTILVQRPGSRELPIFDDSLGTMFQVPYIMGWCYEESVPDFLFQSNVLDLGRDVEVNDQRNNTFDNEFACTYCREP